MSDTYFFVSSLKIPNRIDIFVNLTLTSAYSPKSRFYISEDVDTK
jgi:hypothetical protein